MDATIGTRRTTASRTAALVGTAAALACVAACAPSSDSTGRTREAFAALALTCPEGNINSGSPDGGTPARISPLTQARTWARGGGFAARFPAASPRAVDYDDGTLVLFRDDDQLRAALLYARTGSAWALTVLQYC